MGVLSGNSSKEPLHVGEITGIWAYLLSTNGLLRLYETLNNHAGDDDLKRELQDLHQTMEEETVKLAQLLKENGIPLPPETPERPVADAETIPPGARVLDPEIANIVSMNLGQGLVSCSMVMGQCVREDVGMLFGQFHASKALAGAKWLRLMKKKAWLITPPLQQQLSTATKA